MTTREQIVSLAGQKRLQRPIGEEIRSNRDLINNISAGGIPPEVKSSTTVGLVGTGLTVSQSWGKGSPRLGAKERGFSPCAYSARWRASLNGA